MRPLPVDVATALAVEIAALTVYHSNRIENAGLGMSETEIVIKGIFCPPGGHTMTAFLETWTHSRALALVIDFVRSGLTKINLRPSHLRALHGALMAETPSACPGTWRTDQAFISNNPSQVLATAPEIEGLINQVFEYINSTSDHDIEIVTNVHAWLMRIHPFVDGNGRSIRLLMAFLAMSAGYPGVAFTCGATKYFSTIREWDENPGHFGSLVVGEISQMFSVYERAEKTSVVVAKQRSRKEFTVV
jgi:Fic family protein